MSPDREIAPAEVRLAVERLEAWLVKNGWAGYDPYDLKGTRPFLWALSLEKTTFPRRIFRKLMLGPLLIGESLFPAVLRTVFAVEPKINAKGMGLFATAYFTLYRITGEPRFLARGHECLQWLDANRAAGYRFPCWGYPFDWEAGVLVPAGTPASVVTAAAADAYWAAWEVTGDAAYLGVCEGICEFFLTDLNVDVMDAETLCFSYTPLDDFHVHNTNLMVAELLVRVGSELGRADWVATGKKAANYALREQNADGSLFYWGRIQNDQAPDRVDHYHSGFEMRAFLGLWKATGDLIYRSALERYYAFYRSRLLQADGDLLAPKMYPGSLFPVNVHSCAEALILNAALSGEIEGAETTLARVFPWVIQKMQARDGHFIYLRQRALGIEWPTRIPYIRWGQAWMLLALSRVWMTVVARSDGAHG